MKAILLSHCRDRRNGDLLQRSRWWLAAFLPVVTICVLFGTAIAHTESKKSSKAPPGEHVAVLVPSHSAEQDVATLAVWAGDYIHGVAADMVGRYIVAVQQTEIAQYVAAVHDAEVQAYVASLPKPQPSPPRYVAPAPVSSSGGCASGGGSLDGTSASNIARESGGNYCARNASGACGAYQIMPGTWQNFGGYASACDAPPAVQDEKARSMAPCNWNPPNYCAG